MIIIAIWFIYLLVQTESELIKIDINCNIQGDVVLECTSLHEDMKHEDMMFRIMFNTAFIRSNILILNRDEIDTLWDTKDNFPKEFRAEVCILATTICLVGCLASADSFFICLMRRLLLPFIFY